MERNNSTSRSKKRTASTMRGIDCYFSKNTKTAAFSSPSDLPSTGNPEPEPTAASETSANYYAGRNSVESIAPSSSAFTSSAGDTRDQASAPSSALGGSAFPAISPLKPGSTSDDTEIHKADIGAYVAKIATLDDYTKRMLLQKAWKLSKRDSLPYSVHKKQGKMERRYVQNRHFDDYPWLVLSDIDKGLYCKYCVLFASETGGCQSSTALSTFVRKPLTSFGKLTGKDGAFTIHASRKYHMNAVQAGEDFLKSYDNPKLDVVNQVCSQRMEQVTENRNRLRPIIETIILCGRQNIALRGHRDDGKLTMEEPLTNDGNFRAILRYRAASGDETLKKHLATASSKATYISKSTQNDLIDCCKEEIQDVILSRVKRAGVYSIIFDETTDAAHVEQLSLSLRYIHEGSVREDFFTFADAYDLIREEDVENDERRLTGVALGHCVVDILKKFGLPLKNCVGIGTDNCSVMASDIKGAVQEIIKSCPNAKRCPCFNHSLNNSLAKTSKVVPTRNAIFTMKKVISFANASAKRTTVFRKHLGKGLRGLCETRWIEKHDGILQFKDSCNKIVDTLQEISKWQDSKTSSEACTLMKALLDGEFIVAMICLSDVLSVTRSLSLYLQASSLDLNSACDALRDTLDVIRTSRNDADTHFARLFATATTIGEELGVAIEIPRIAARQIYRSNYAANTAEEYYRKSIFLPLLDHVMNDLENRLPEETLKVFDLNLLMPSVKIMENTTADDELDRVRSLANQYNFFLGVGSVSGLVGEFQVWRAAWRRRQGEKTLVPQTAVQVLDHCSEHMYPNIRCLIQILATLPVSVATVERSFSTLRRLKSWLRTRMREERLAGLALLHIHLDIHIVVDRIIERFSKMKNRRLDFIV